MLIPLQCETLSHRGVGQLLDTVHDVRRFTNRGLEVLGRAADAVRRPHQPRAHRCSRPSPRPTTLDVIEPPIPKSIRFAEAPAAGRSILSTCRTQQGRRRPTARSPPAWLARSGRVDRAAPGRERPSVSDGSAPRRRRRGPAPRVRRARRGRDHGGGAGRARALRSGRGRRRASAASGRRAPARGRRRRLTARRRAGRHRRSSTVAEGSPPGTADEAAADAGRRPRRRRPLPARLRPGPPGRVLRERPAGLAGRAATQTVDAHLPRLGQPSTDNLDPGSYEVYSRSERAVGDRRLRHDGVLRPLHPRRATPRSASTTSPINDGRPVQTVAQLGTPQSHGCIRQRPRRDRAVGVRPVGTHGRRHRLSAGSAVTRRRPDARSAAGDSPGRRHRPRAARREFGVVAAGCGCRAGSRFGRPAAASLVTAAGRRARSCCGRSVARGRPPRPRPAAGLAGCASATTGPRRHRGPGRRDDHRRVRRHVRSPPPPRRRPRGARRRRALETRPLVPAAMPRSWKRCSEVE